MKLINKKGNFGFLSKSAVLFIIIMALVAIIVYFLVKFLPRGIAFARMFGR
jgi:hypothetical protein